MNWEPDTYPVDPRHCNVYMPIRRGFIRVATTLQMWMDTTPHLTVEKIIHGINQIRDFFRVRELQTWIHPSLLDMTVVYMLRTRAPPSQPLSMAIRRMIISEKFNLLVSIFDTPSRFRVIARNLAVEPRNVFTHPTFRKDCEIALACAYNDGGDPLFNDANALGQKPLVGRDRLKALGLCIIEAHTFVRRLPLIRYHVDAPLTIDDLHKFNGSTRDIRITAMCAHIMGLTP